MAEYQNIFTQLQVVGPIHDGVQLPRSDSPRTGRPMLMHLAGRLGNAQIGPIYLGGLGLASLIFGLLSFWICLLYTSPSPRD